jgi:hypothetical protein
MDKRFDDVIDVCCQVRINDGTGARCHAGTVKMTYMSYGAEYGLTYLTNVARYGLMTYLTQVAGNGLMT